MEKCRSCINGLIYDTTPIGTVQTSSGGGQNVHFEPIVMPDENLAKIFKELKAIRALINKLILQGQKNV
jgi:hypothetical protein